MRIFVSHRQKLALIIVALVTMAGTGGYFQPTATRATSPNRCVSFSDSAIVVNPNGVLVAGGTETLGPVSAALTSGNYRIEAESYSESAPQDQERWFMEGYNNGVKVFTSAITPDLNNPGPEQYVLHTSAALPEIDEIKFVHALVGQNTNPPNHSVEPCAGFVRLADTRIQTTPTPQIVAAQLTQSQVANPIGGIGAGTGGAANSMMVPAAGLAGALTSLGYGILRLRQRKI